MYHRDPSRTPAAAQGAARFGAGPTLLVLGLVLLGCASLSALPQETAGSAAAEAAAPYRILVTNDDGIDSPGLAALVEALDPLGEVAIVAPLDNQSGIGHALDLRDPIYLARREVAGRPAFALSGTPATCVRIALANLLRDAPPDLVVSGVNRGLNFGRNAYISGTLGAAREAAIQGLPAIAVSLAREAHPEYAAAAAAAAEVVAAVKREGLPATVFLNVNVPAGTPRGLRPSRQSLLAGSESYEARRNPYGRPYFWSFFSQPTARPELGSDIEAVGAGWVAVTPLEATEAADGAMDLLRRMFPLAETSAAPDAAEQR